MYDIFRYVLKNIYGGKMKKEFTVTMRVDKEEFEEIKRKSKNLSMNSSEFVRFCVNNALHDNYIPKTKLMFFLHKIYSDSELKKLDKVVKLAKELEESCI